MLNAIVPIAFFRNFVVNVFSGSPVLAMLHAYNAACKQTMSRLEERETKRSEKEQQRKKSSFVVQGTMLLFHLTRTRTPNPATRLTALALIPYATDAYCLRLKAKAVAEDS